MGDDIKTRYPRYDALANWDSPDWDDQTREVVRRRIEEVPTTHFLNDHEVRTLRAVADRVVPQPARDEQTRVPIVPWIDQMLHERATDGYRFETLPPMREAWRRGLKGLDQTARALYDRDFADLEGDHQEAVLERVSGGDPPGDAWEGMDAKRFFADELCAEILTTYYAHPRAWSEIGYGGPASPRGHVRKWEDGLDPWEPEEDDDDR